ncbi:hypothetical protein BaRGS_00031840 [Batillaria attramentaria]|uniref:Uncharacterized protein n=1 Tax=Batillaria attramentaria TaxID=370345 RepID=A0ABD0JPE9_9CAEN
MFDSRNPTLAAFSIALPASFSLDKREQTLSKSSQFDHWRTATIARPVFSEQLAGSTTFHHADGFIYAKRIGRTSAHNASHRSCHGCAAADDRLPAAASHLSRGASRDLNMAVYS